MGYISVLIIIIIQCNCQSNCCLYFNIAGLQQGINVNSCTDVLRCCNVSRQPSTPPLFFFLTSQSIFATVCLVLSSVGFGVYS